VCVCVCVLLSVWQYILHHLMVLICTSCQITGIVGSTSLFFSVIMTPPLIGRALMGAFVWCLSVWRLSVAYIEPKSKTGRPRKTKIGTEVAHVTRDSYTTFEVKRSRSSVLLTAALTHQTAAVVSVGTYWAWETTATLRCARRRFGAQSGRRGAGAYHGGRPPTTY